MQALQQNRATSPKNTEQLVTIRKPKECTMCGKAVSSSYMCRRCGRELRELLIGKPNENTTQPGTLLKGQPGIIWYISRLRESAYQQTVMDRNTGTKGSRDGYYLFGDKRAIDLLGKISVTLDNWACELDKLVAPYRHEDDGSGVIAWPDGMDGLDGWRARYLAAHIPELRHQIPTIVKLHAELLQHAKDAWRIINRPNDICCGACTNEIADRDNPGEMIVCGVMLYAEEHADKVQCPRCRAEYDVKEMRDDLNRRTHNMLFTGSELLRLMETRLNDKMPKSTFYQLIKDGRLRCRTTRREDDGKETPMYTYDDVCAAKLKSKPGRQPKRAKAEKPCQTTK